MTTATDVRERLAAALGVPLSMFADDGALIDAAAEVIECMPRVDISQIDEPVRPLGVADRYWAPGSRIAIHIETGRDGTWAFDAEAATATVRSTDPTEWASDRARLGYAELLVRQVAYRHRITGLDTSEAALAAIARLRTACGA